MKNFLLTLILIGGATFGCYPSPGTSNNGDMYYEIPLYDEENGEDAEDVTPVEEPQRRARMPRCNKSCIISNESGVLINGSPVSDRILSYRIYGVDGVCLAVFADEFSFVNFIFSGISGEYVLRFLMDKDSYAGTIYI